MGGYRLQQTVTVVRSKLQNAVIHGADDARERRTKVTSLVQEKSKPWNKAGARYRPSSRIAASSPSSVSGYIRPPMSCRIIRIDSVKSHSRSATGLSHTHDG